MLKYFVVSLLALVSGASAAENNPPANNPIIPGLYSWTYSGENNRMLYRFHGDESTQMMEGLIKVVFDWDKKKFPIVVVTNRGICPRMAEYGIPCIEGTSDTHPDALAMGQYYGSNDLEEIGRKYETKN